MFSGPGDAQNQNAIEKLWLSINHGFHRGAKMAENLIEPAYSLIPFDQQSLRV